MIDINDLIVRNLPFVIKDIKYRDEIIWRDGNFFVYFKDLVENLSKNTFFLQIIKEKFSIKVKENDNWQEILFALQKNVKYKNMDMMSALLSFITELLEDVLLNLFYNIETFSALDAFAFKSNNEEIKGLFQKLMEFEINCILDGNFQLLKATGGNEITEKIWGINYPFFMLYFNKLEKEINVNVESLNELDKNIENEINESKNENYNDFEKIPEMKNEKEKLLEKTREIIINGVFAHDQELKDSIDNEFNEISAILIQDLVNCYMQKHFRIKKNFEKTQKLLLKSIKYLCPIEKAESFCDIWIFMATKQKFTMILLNIFDYLFLDENLYEYCLENIENLKRNELNPEENWTLLINLILKCYLPNLFIYKNTDFVGKYSRILESVFSDIYSLFIELNQLFINRNLVESLSDFLSLIYTTKCGVLEEDLIKGLVILQLEKENNENGEAKEEEKEEKQEIEEVKKQIPLNFDIFQNAEIQKYITKHIKLIKEKYSDVKPTESPLRELYYFQSAFLFAIFEENEKNPDEEQREKSVKFVLNEIFFSKELLPFCVKTIEDVIGAQVPMHIPNIWALFKI